ncbi:MAG TPA: tripartite tricarboxylate transporter substrate binding protein [Usitatibacteraceae bacterium]|nr:tripartite tricarboxylate transporter substrate binding protein [Usitatibacteraceae bacterium]
MPVQSRTRITRALAALAAGLCLSTGAAADAWPGKTIKIIIPFAAGGVTDVVIRTISPKLSEALGQPVVIENKGGAGGTLGTAMGAAAAPDGYTFIAPAASHTTTPSLYSKLSFDPVKDFAAVTQIVTVPYLLVVPASSPMQTLADFIAAAKAKPGTLTFGSAGNGSSNHLAGELLAGSIGAPLVHVPYKGSGPALADVLGGQLSFMFDTINTSTGHVKAGKLRVLGVGTTKRSKIMPDVAPIADTVPGFEAVTWIGLLAPAGTPKEIVARMHREIEKIVQMPEVQERLSASGAEPVASTPEQFGAYLSSEVAKWGRVVKQAKIPPVQ